MMRGVFPKGGTQRKRIRSSINSSGPSHGPGNSKLHYRKKAGKGPGSPSVGAPKPDKYNRAIIRSSISTLKFPHR